jgi:hypothetical protein
MVGMSDKRIDDLEIKPSIESNTLLALADVIETELSFDGISVGDSDVPSEYQDHFALIHTCRGNQEFSIKDLLLLKGYLLAITTEQIMYDQDTYPEKTQYVFDDISVSLAGNLVNTVTMMLQDAGYDDLVLTPDQLHQASDYLNEYCDNYFQGSNGGRDDSHHFTARDRIKAVSFS